MNRFLTIFLILSLFAACNSDDYDPFVRVEPNSIVVPAAGGDYRIIVGAALSWTMSGNAEWCTPSATSGQDGEAIAFEIAANTSGKERSVTYTFTCGKQTATLTVTQSGKTGSVDFGDYEEENWN